jgi:hypothetical protein
MNDDPTLPPGTLHLAAMERLLEMEDRRSRTYTFNPFVIDARGPFEQLADLRRILGPRRAHAASKRKGVASPGPTSKRAKVKAARKANVRRRK